MDASHGDVDDDEVDSLLPKIYTNRPFAFRHITASCMTSVNKLHVEYIRLVRKEKEEKKGRSAFI
jgi:hypothetical protein